MRHRTKGTKRIQSHSCHSRYIRGRLFLSDVGTGQRSIPNCSELLYERSGTRPRGKPGRAGGPKNGSIILAIAVIVSRNGNIAISSERECKERKVLAARVWRTVGAQNKNRAFAIIRCMPIFIGGGGEDRTPDLGVMNPAL